jgi:hypothetical protein
MGVYTDLLSGTEAWDSGGADGISIGPDRVITMQIEQLQVKQGDVPYPSGYTEVDEVQEIGTYNGTVSSGNFTLTVNVDDTARTTANIAYDASAATIETAIDTVCSGNVTDWTNGDIAVSLVGDLTANAATLTYSGNAVDATNHPAVIINDIDLGGGGTVGDVTTTTNGQTVRTALAALNVMGVIDSPPPPQGTTSGLTATSTRASYPEMPRQEVLQALAKQAAIDDDTDAMYSALMTAMGLQRLL